MILGSHPDFTCLNEIEQLPKDVALDTICSCGQHVSGCSFWLNTFELLKQRYGTNILDNPYTFELGFPKAGVVIDHAHQTPQYLLKRKAILGLKYIEYRYGLSLLPASLSKEFACRIENTFRLFEAVTNVSNRPGIVDSSKHYGRAISLFEARPEMVKIILLIRDGRAVFNANLRMGRTLSKSLAFWKIYYERALPLLTRKVSYNSLHILKYEDLVTHTRSSLEKLCAFLDVSYYPSMLNFREGPKHGLSGNAMRLSSASELMLDERWRSQLAPEELGYFKRNGGQRLNDLLGYALD